MNRPHKNERGGDMKEPKNVLTSAKSKENVPPKNVGTSPKSGKREPRNVITCSKEG
jgi:hypothetical protein